MIFLQFVLLWWPLNNNFMLNIKLLYVFLKQLSTVQYTKLRSRFVPKGFHFLFQFNGLQYKKLVR